MLSQMVGHLGQVGTISHYWCPALWDMVTDWNIVFCVCFVPEWDKRDTFKLLENTRFIAVRQKGLLCR